MTSPSSSATLIDLIAIEPVNCACGVARRALTGHDGFPGTLHLTDISCDAVPHFHREHTELYVVLDCGENAAIEVDGVQYDVAPLTAVLIPPHVIHRAIGEMRVLIICIPDFDSENEHFP